MILYGSAKSPVKRSQGTHCECKQEGRNYAASVADDSAGDIEEKTRVDPFPF
jgi:hypothetical protein